nr:Chain B, Ribonucleoside-diphosphate reductase small chain 2 [synthetic construct]
KEINFDDDF